MAIKNYVSNYFWYTFVDSIDVFDCLSSFVLLYASRVLNTIESNYLELLVLVRKIYNNDDITFFSVYILRVVKHPCVLNINEAKTS